MKLSVDVKFTQVTSLQTHNTCMFTPDRKVHTVLPLFMFYAPGTLQLVNHFADIQGDQNVSVHLTF